MFPSRGEGSSWKLRRAVARLAADAGHTPPTDRAGRSYRNALVAALGEKPPLALDLFRRYDALIPPRHHATSFGPEDEGWLSGLASSDDPDVLTVAFELSTRLGLGDPQRAARDRLALVLARGTDGDRLIRQLHRWQQLELLDRDLLARTVRGVVASGASAPQPQPPWPQASDAREPGPFDRHPAAWSEFFARLPEALLPDVSDLYSFLGRGAEAARLADTAASVAQALACCLRSQRLDDVLAGVALAQRSADPATVKRLEGRAGDLLYADQRYAEALDHYRGAGRADRISECAEHLGDFRTALSSCPAQQPERLARLVGRCLPEVDAHVERDEYADAVRLAGTLEEHLGRAEPAIEAIHAARLEVTAQRAAALAVGRKHYADVLAGSGSAGHSAGGSAGGSAATSREAHLAWSQLEEDAGQPAAAAAQADLAGDHYRAHRLYRAAGQFGDASRVLQDDHTPAGLASRASVREAGGDLPGAADLYREARRWEEAVTLYVRAGHPGEAAACLLEWRGDDAIDDPRLAACLRRAGEIERLVRVCLRAAEASGHAGAIGELRALRAEGLVPVNLDPAVQAGLERLDSVARGPFEARAQAWVARARAEIDARFAGIWALDLGTTTCAAAIYDAEAGKAVLCRWRDQPHFASTLSVDENGNELVGLAGEEVFGGRVTGHIEAAKRRMGSSTHYRIGSRGYRPEEVAARLISHARELVENHLAGCVRERVGALARAELGELRDEWLSWAADNHDLRVRRHRVLLTIPAYFRNNQKHATRNACEIAGVEPVRLIHEPTAACIAVARARKLTGRVAVVDLGAGTLDVSLLEVEENVYEVQQVLGDNNYGGRDFDDAITEALAGQLAARGIEIGKSGTARRRLAVAAEYLKIALSGREDADYTLRGLVDQHDVDLHLDRAGLAEILAGPLGVLDQTCRAFSGSLDHPPDHLILVGGPVLSPLVRTLIEQAFGLACTPPPDPRTAVASGAALQAAVLDGKLRELLLLDVTPLALGIRAFDDDGQEQLSTLVERNSRIPVEKRGTYTTTRDNQTSVHIEIFNGSLDAQAKIGQFTLDGLPPVQRGVPQIEVTFAIDASCVLEVTAHDQATGASKSVQVTDTTLLSPPEIAAMVRRHQRQQERDDVRRQIRELVADAAEDDSEASWQEFRHRLDRYRPSTGPADEDAARSLAEMFRDQHQMEVDLLLARTTLNDLTTAAQRYLGRPPDDLGDAAMAEGRLLIRKMRPYLAQLRSSLERLARWNAVLVGLAVAEPDPLRRFRRQHEAGDYRAALASFGQLRAGLTDVDDLRGHLRCLAETGDAEGYRSALRRYAERLSVLPLDPADPEPFLARVRQAQADILIDGVAVARGFLVGDGLVATTRHSLRGPDGQPVDPALLGVVLADRARTVALVELPESPRLDVALLRLAGSAAPARDSTLAGDSALAGDGARAGARQPQPLPLGPPDLVRIDEQVWVVVPTVPTVPTGVTTLRPAVVNGFETFAELDLRLFRIGLDAPPESSGTPVLNDLGEVVGLLTVTRQARPAGAGTFAITVDALHPLLATESPSPR